MTGSSFDWFWGGIEDEENNGVTQPKSWPVGPLKANVFTISESYININVHLEGEDYTVQVEDTVFPKLELGDPILVWFVENKPQLFNPNWAVNINNYELHYGKELELIIESIDKNGAYSSFLGRQVFIPVKYLRFKNKAFGFAPSSSLVGERLTIAFQKIQNEYLIFSQTLASLPSQVDIIQWSSLSIEIQQYKYHRALHTLNELSKHYDEFIVYRADPEDMLNYFMYCYGIPFKINPYSIAWDSNNIIGNFQSFKSSLSVDLDFKSISAGIRSSNDVIWQKIKELYPIGEIVVLKGEYRSRLGIVCVVEDSQYIVGGCISEYVNSRGNCVIQNNIPFDVNGVKIQARVCDYDETTTSLMLDPEPNGENPWVYSPYEVDEWIPVEVFVNHIETYINWFSGFISVIKTENFFDMYGDALLDGSQIPLWAKISKLDQDEKRIEFSNFKRTIRFNEIPTSIINEYNSMRKHRGLNQKDFTLFLSENQEIEIQRLRFYQGVGRVKLGFENNSYINTIPLGLGKKVTWDEESLKNIRAICEEDQIVKGKIIATVKGGFKVSLPHNIVGFLPRSHFGIRRIKSPYKHLVGQEHEFKIIKFNSLHKSVTVSRRIILNSEAKKTLHNLEVGQILTGNIRSIVNYGVFVDLGGVSGLIHLTDLSWGRVHHPTDILGEDAENNPITVKVLNFDLERERVSLGLKQLRDNPWNKVAEKYVANQRVSGTVVSLTDYGAFLELEEGIEGLIHVSEMSWTGNIKKPEKLFAKGDLVEAQILDIDVEGERISLGYKQLQENPWVKLKEQFYPGRVIKGPVQNITDFGIFISITPEIDGLVHVSDMSWNNKIKHPSQLYTKRDIVEAIVLEVNSDDQRCSLGIKQLTDDPWELVHEQIKVGDSCNGAIVDIVDFGLFIQHPIFEPFICLLHKSEIILGSDYESLSDFFNLGELVDTIVIDINENNKTISLSQKCTILKDHIKELYVGYETEAVINLITPSFIQVVFGELNNLFGIIENKNLSWYNIEKNNEYIKGDQIRVKILEIDEERYIVKFGVKQLDLDPWLNLLREVKPIGKIFPCKLLRVDNGIANVIIFIDQLEILGIAYFDSSTSSHTSDMVCRISSISRTDELSFDVSLTDIEDSLSHIEHLENTILNLRLKQIVNGITFVHAKEISKIYKLDKCFNTVISDSPPLSNENITAIVKRRNNQILLSLDDYYHPIRYSEFDLDKQTIYQMTVVQVYSFGIRLHYKEKFFFIYNREILPHLENPKDVISEGLTLNIKYKAKKSKTGIVLLQHTPMSQSLSFLKEEYPVGKVFRGQIYQQKDGIYYIKYAQQVVGMLSSTKDYQVFEELDIYVIGYLNIAEFKILSLSDSFPETNFSLACTYQDTDILVNNTITLGSPLFNVLVLDSTWKVNIDLNVDSFIKSLGFFNGVIEYIRYNHPSGFLESPDFHELGKNYFDRWSSKAFRRTIKNKLLALNRLKWKKSRYYYEYENDGVTYTIKSVNAAKKEFTAFPNVLETNINNIKNDLDHSISILSNLEQINGKIVHISEGFCFVLLFDYNLTAYMTLAHDSKLVLGSEVNVKPINMNVKYKYIIVELTDKLNKFEQEDNIPENQNVDIKVAYPKLKTQIINPHNRAKPVHRERTMNDTMHIELLERILNREPEPPSLVESLPCPLAKLLKKYENADENEKFEFGIQLVEGTLRFLMMISVAQLVQKDNFKEKELEEWWKTLSHPTYGKLLFFVERLFNRLKEHNEQHFVKNWLNAYDQSLKDSLNTLSMHRNNHAHTHYFQLSKDKRKKLTHDVLIIIKNLEPILYCLTKYSLGVFENPKKRPGASLNTLWISGRGNNPAGLPVDFARNDELYEEFVYLLSIETGEALCLNPFLVREKVQSEYCFLWIDHHTTEKVINGQKVNIDVYRDPVFTDSMISFDPQVLNNYLRYPKSYHCYHTFEITAAQSREIKGEVALEKRRYKVMNKLGEGGMGVVYRVLDHVLDDQLAVKMLREENVFKGHAKERFRREARLLNQLNHKHIVRSEYFYERDPAALLMEYVDGQSLETYLTENNCTISQAVKLMKQLLSALSYTHKKSIIHRDIKPSNLLINVQGDLKIADFGLAREITGNSFTESSLFAGTYDYMAPELRKTKRKPEPSPLSDIYSCGLVFAALLGQDPPFPPNGKELQISEPLTDPLIQFYNKARAFKPQDRFESVDIMQTMINKLLTDHNEELSRTSEKLKTLHSVSDRSTESSKITESVDLYHQTVFSLMESFDKEFDEILEYAKLANINEVITSKDSILHLDSITKIKRLVNLKDNHIPPSSHDDEIDDPELLNKHLSLDQIIRGTSQTRSDNSTINQQVKNTNEKITPNLKTLDNTQNIKPELTDILSLIQKFSLEFDEISRIASSLNIHLKSPSQKINTEQKMAIVEGIELYLSNKVMHKAQEVSVDISQQHQGEEESIYQDYHDDDRDDIKPSLDQIMTQVGQLKTKRSRVQENLPKTPPTFVSTPQVHNISSKSLDLPVDLHESNDVKTTLNSEQLKIFDIFTSSPTQKKDTLDTPNSKTKTLKRRIEKASSQKEVFKDNSHQTTETKLTEEEVINHINKMLSKHEGGLALSEVGTDLSLKWGTKWFTQFGHSKLIKFIRSIKEFKLVSKDGYTYNIYLKDHPNHVDNLEQSLGTVHYKSDPWYIWAISRDRKSRDLPRNPLRLEVINEAISLATDTELLKIVSAVLLSWRDHTMIDVIRSNQNIFEELMTSSESELIDNSEMSCGFSISILSPSFEYSLAKSDERYTIYKYRMIEALLKAGYHDKAYEQLSGIDERGELAYQLLNNNTQVFKDIGLDLVNLFDQLVMILDHLVIKPHQPSLVGQVSTKLIYKGLELFEQGINTSNDDEARNSLLELAIESFSRAKRENTNDRICAMYNLAITKLYLKKTNLALEELESILDIKPKDINIKWLIALCHWRAQRIPEALEASRMVLDFEPYHKYARLASSLCSYHLGDYESSLESIAVTSLIGTLLHTPKYPESFKFALALVANKGIKDGYQIIRKVLFSHYRLKDWSQERLEY